LRLATEDGARVLGWDDIGRLEPGGRADIAVCSGEDLVVAPDAPAGLVLGAGFAVCYRLVAGKTVVTEGELLRGIRRELVFDNPLGCSGGSLL